MVKYCVICRKEFTTENARQILCSSECKLIRRRVTNKKREERGNIKKNRVICGHEFETTRFYRILCGSSSCRKEYTRRASACKAKEIRDTNNQPQEREFTQCTDYQISIMTLEGKSVRFIAEMFDRSEQSVCDRLQMLIDTKAYDKHIERFKIASPILYRRATR